MPVSIALYRGINVGGKNPVRMEALRAMHERLGHRGVKNYVQSGNIVFSAPGPADAVARKLVEEFDKTFGFAAKLMVLDAKYWGLIVRGNPYGESATKDPKLAHVGFGKSRFAAAMERAGGVPMTILIWRTMTALWEMVKGRM